MRIEAYNQIQQVYQSTKVSSAQKMTDVKKTDKLQISAFGMDMQVAKQAVANVPDIREELTTPLRESIAAGSYNVSNESFADKVLSKYFNTEQV